MMKTEIEIQEVRRKEEEQLLKHLEELERQKRESDECERLRKEREDIERKKQELEQHKKSSEAGIAGLASSILTSEAKPDITNVSVEKKDTAAFAVTSPAISSTADDLKKEEEKKFDGVKKDIVDDSSDSKAGNKPLPPSVDKSAGKTSVSEAGLGKQVSKTCENPSSSPPPPIDPELARILKIKSMKIYTIIGVVVACMVVVVVFSVIGIKTFIAELRNEKNHSTIENKPFETSSKQPAFKTEKKVSSISERKPLKDACDDLRELINKKYQDDASPREVVSILDSQIKVLRELLENYKDQSSDPMYQRVEKFYEMKMKIRAQY